jgi:hypothetical protein
MDRWTAEVLREWVVNMDRELREWEASNGEEGGKGPGQGEFAGSI